MDLATETLFEIYKKQTTIFSPTYMNYQCHDDDVYYDFDYRDHDDNGFGHSYDDYFDNV